MHMKLIKWFVLYDWLICALSDNFNFIKGTALMVNTIYVKKLRNGL